jgi:tetratricopeptide (TPR) repeat protein
MFRFRTNQLLVTLGLLFGLLVSSCSSLMDTSATTPKTGDPRAEKDETEKAAQLTTDGQPAIPFQGVDPMADIQLNAEIRKTYKEVAKLSKAKKYSVAISLLDSVQKKYPQLSGPDYQKARIYLNQGKLQQALTAVELSLKNNSRNYYSLNLKGVILKELGQFEQSREVYLTAIKIYPPYPNSHLNLGVLADIYMGELSLALIQYREYMKLVDNQDKTVANWILELERRIKAGL